MKQCWELLSNDVASVCTKPYTTSRPKSHVYTQASKYKRAFLAHEDICVHIFVWSVYVHKYRTSENWRVRDITGLKKTHTPVKIADIPALAKTLYMLPVKSVLRLNPFSSRLNW